VALADIDYILARNGPSFARARDLADSFELVASHSSLEVSLIELTVVDSRFAVAAR
jgi:hypothetical protein